MLFTTLQWLLFLFTAFVTFHLVDLRLRKWIMLLASVVFYASWSVPYLALIGGQLVVDWSCGHLLARTSRPKRRKLLLATSIVVNLSALLLFKYYGLLARTTHAFGLELPVLELTLPLAISFYTFESMSYTIDVYRGRLQPVRSPLHLALFITWFPHLIAGPIIRPAELIPQVQAPPAVTEARFFTGLWLMASGYSKKLLGADWLARVVDPVFAAPAQFTSLELLIAVYAYAFQIYLDFSAYTDIARGASRWFGVELPENFDDPYLSSSITEFWRRWHMTLSHWLRDYLYIPLGGNRHGALRTYLNLLITMLLGGLWHGANWTFVIWGGIHGVLLAIERALRLGDHPTPAGRLARQVLTFHLVCFAWIFFRAASFADVASVLRGLAAGSFSTTAEHAVSMFGALAIIAGYWAVRAAARRLPALVPRSLPQQLVSALGVAALLLILTIFGASSGAFIYFQF